MRSKIVEAIINAQVAELVDALVLEASAERRVGSSPTLGTNKKKEKHENRRINSHSTI